MEQLPKIVRERLQAGTKPEVHPDPDLLTAFAENSLPERERLPLLEHLSTCGDCREVVSLAQPELAVQHVAAVAAAGSPAPPRPYWPGRLLFGWGTVAACVVIGLVLLRYQTRENKLAQIASKQLPAEQGAESAASTEQLTPRPQPTSPPPENELAAKLVRPAPPKPKSELQSNMDSVRRERSISSQLMAKKLDKAGTAKGALMGAMAARPAQPMPQSSEQVTVSGEAAEIASAPVPQQEIPLQARSFAAKEASKDVAAAAAPPAVQAENKPVTSAHASAAAPTAGVSGGIGSGLGSAGAFAHQKTSLATAQAAANQKVALARISSNYIPTRWSISSDGATLLRSTDGGGSWNPVNVANNVVFRTVAALGPEVWAGGKAGTLYHSSDLGAHWTQVKPDIKWLCAHSRHREHRFQRSCARQTDHIRRQSLDHR